MKKPTGQENIFLNDALIKIVEVVEQKKTSTEHFYLKMRQV